MKAAQALNKDDWLRIAESGLQTVLADWESAAATVYTDTASLNEVKTQKEINLRYRLQEALADWAIARFADDGSSADTNIVVDYIHEYWITLRDEALEATFKKENGEFILDENGDYQVNVADGETYDKETKELRNRWEKLLDRLAGLWRNHAETAYDDMAYEYDEEIKKLIQDKRTVTLDNLAGMHRREMTKLAGITESMMARYRLHDAWSMRRHSEGETAESRSQDMLADVEAKTKEGLERLKNSLKMDGADASVNPADIDAEQWLESFRDELEKGIDLWDKAEANLLKNRGEWEKSSAEDYAEGDKVWNEALDKLLTMQSRWMESYNALYAQGETLLKEQNTELETTLNRAQQELQENKETLQKALEERLNVWKELLARSNNMMNTARDNFIYWLNKIEEDKKVDANTITRDVQEMRQKLWEIIKSSKESVMLRAEGDVKQLDDFSETMKGALGMSQNANALSKLHNILKELGEQFLQIIYNGIPDATQLKDRSATEYLETVILNFVNNNLDDFVDEQYTQNGELDAGEFVDVEWKTLRKYFLDDYSNFQSIIINNRYGYEMWKNTIYKDHLIQWEKYYNDYVQYLEPYENGTQDLQDEFYTKEEFKQYLRELVNKAFFGNSPAEQAAWWLETYENYRKKTEEAKNELLNTWGIGLKDEAMDTVSLDELTGDIFATDEELWETMFLDDYQSELIQARMEQRYWEEEQTIAQEVKDYADDESSGRATQAETEADYQAKLDAYNEALEAYKESQANLEAWQTNLDSKKATIEAIRKKIETAGSDLTKARKEYQAKLLAMELAVPNGAKEQVEEYYKKLLTLKGLTADTDDDGESLAQAWTDHLEAVKETFPETHLENAVKLAKNRIEGVGKELSLEELKTRYDKAKTWVTTANLDTDGTPKDDSDFMDKFKATWSLSAEDAIYITVNEWYNTLTQTPSPKPESIARFRMDMEWMTSQMLADYRNELEMRVNQIALLTDPNALSAPTWTGWNTALDDDNENYDAVTETLKTNAEQEQAQWMQKRVESDLAVLEDLKQDIDKWKPQGNSPEDFKVAIPTDYMDKTQYLQWLYFSNVPNKEVIIAHLLANGDLAGARELEKTTSLEWFLERDIKRLEGIKTAFENNPSQNNANPDTSTYDTDQLEQELDVLFNNGNPLGLTYRNGGSLFTYDGKDYGTVFLNKDEYSLYRQKMMAQSLWEGLGRQSTVAVTAPWRAEEINTAIESIYTTLEADNLAEKDTDTEEWTLTDPEAAWEANFPDNNSWIEVLNWLVEMTDNTDPYIYSSAIDPAVRESLVKWRQNLVNYFLAKSLHLSQEPDESEIQKKQTEIETLEASINKKSEWLTNMRTTTDPVQAMFIATLIDADDSETEERLKRALAMDMAASYDIIDTVNVDDDATWQTIIDTLKNDTFVKIWDLDLNHPTIIQEKADQYCNEAKTLAIAMIKEAQAFATGDNTYAGYEEKLINSHLNEQSLEQYAFDILSLGKEGKNKLLALKLLDEYLDGMDQDDTWDGNDATTYFANKNNSEIFNYINDINGITQTVLTNAKVRDELKNVLKTVITPGILATASGHALYANTLAGMLAALVGKETAEWCLSSLNIIPDNTLNLDSFPNPNNPEDLMLTLYGMDDHATLYYLKRAALNGQLTETMKNQFNLSQEQTDALKAFTDALDEGTDISADAFFAQGLPSEAKTDLQELKDWAVPYWNSMKDRWKVMNGNYVNLLYGNREEHIKVKEDEKITKARKLSYIREMAQLQNNPANTHRLYLSNAYLPEIPQKNDEGETVTDDNSETDPETTEPLPPGKPAPAVQSKGIDDETKYHGSTDKDTALILETMNQLTASGKLLTQALDSLKIEQSAVTSTDIENYKDWFNNNIGTQKFDAWIDTQNPTFNYTLNEYTMDGSLSANMKNTHKEWNKRQTALIEAMTAIDTYGNIVKTFNDIQKEDLESAINTAKEKLDTAKDTIRDLEEQWKNAIGDTIPQDDILPDADIDTYTYREAEHMYDKTYNEVKEKLSMLNEAKQKFKIAKAIQDYASSGYLNAQQEEATEENIEGLYDDELIQQAADLRQSIDAVDPDERLADVTDNLRRASLVVDMLSKEYQVNKPLIERDRKYKGLMEDLEKSKRDEIGLEQLANRLADAVYKAEKDYNEKKAEREEYFKNFYRKINFQAHVDDDSDPMDYDKAITKFLASHGTQGVLLKQLDIKWNDGTPIITWDFVESESTEEEKQMRIERLKQFFGVTESVNDNKNFEDMTDLLLLELSRENSALVTWLDAATYECSQKWINSRLYALYGETPDDNGWNVTKWTVNPGATD